MLNTCSRYKKKEKEIKKNSLRITQKLTKQPTNTFDLVYYSVLHFRIHLLPKALLERISRHGLLRIPIIKLKSHLLILALLLTRTTNILTNWETGKFNIWYKCIVKRLECIAKTVLTVLLKSTLWQQCVCTHHRLL